MTPKSCDHLQCASDGTINAVQEKVVSSTMPRAMSQDAYEFTRVALGAKAASVPETLASSFTAKVCPSTP